MCSFVTSHVKRSLQYHKALSKIKQRDPKYIKKTSYLKHMKHIYEYNIYDFLIV